MGDRDRAKETGRAGLGRWVGASALVHAALLALVAGLIVRFTGGREETLKVSLVAVGPQPSPVLPSSPPHGMPGAPGREGAGRLGGDERPVTAPPRRRPPAPPAAAIATGQDAQPRATPPEERPPQGAHSASPQEPARPAGGMAGPPEPAPSVTPRSVAEAPLPPPLPEAPGQSSIGGARIGPQESPAPGTAEDASGGAGRGVGRGAGRGLGPAPGSGSGLVGTGPGAAGEGTGTGGGGRLLDLTDILAQIRQRIEAAKRYPEAARREGIEGIVTVRFRLRADGGVERAEVVSSSGSRALDEASLETVHRAAPFPPVRGWIRVPFDYNLTEGHR